MPSQTLETTTTRADGGVAVRAPARRPLRVAAATDPLEHEAERVADRLVATREPAGLPQRACACGGTPGPDGECAECKARRLGLQRLGAAAAPAVAPPVVHEVLASPGRPLDDASRSFFEQRLGRDLSSVRLHTDPQSAQSAQAVNAHAYTVGDHVVFGRRMYAPETTDGRRLLAHELAHTIQQSDGRAQLQRQPVPAPAPAPAPAFGPACGVPNPCQAARCTTPATIVGDLGRAIGYVQNAIVALNASPLTADTIGALDWYFNSHSAATVTRAQARLVCIRDCLADTNANSRFGCHPDNDNLAYVCMGATPICTDALVPICYTNAHASTSPRVRAQTSIHECAHRVGMSLGRPTSVEDIYRFTAHFLYMDTDDLLRNADSYALFAGAITEGVPTSLLISGSIGFGFAAPSRGRTTWQLQLYGGVELQRPVFGLFNPTLGIAGTFIGESVGGPGLDPSGTSLLTSLRVGVRLSDPRPGSAGGGYFSIFGGPALAIPVGSPPGAAGAVPTKSPDLRLGAEAGVAAGYRWRWVDLSAGIGYAYDPVRAAGAENLVTGTLRLTFSTGDILGD